MSWIASTRNLQFFRQRLVVNNFPRHKSNEHRGIVNEPPRVPFGIPGVLITVISGLLIGAAISKNIANFLEENDLFVPSDDDDDDD